MGHSGKAGENIFWAMNRNKPGIIKRILNALERFIARIRGKDAYLAVEQRQAAERLRDMLTGELKRAYGTDVKGEAAVESGEGKRHSLAGANSRTADLNSLGGAYQMYQNGVSMDTIRKRTGWWLGKDGKWRYEISDKEMRFNPEGYVDNPQTVGDYVKHDRLFAAYPWIADIPVHMVDVVTGGSPATNGKYSPDGKFIELKKGLTSEKAKYVLSHELQHAIQQAEGFVRGTSPKTGMFYAVNLAYDLVKNNPEFVAESKPQDKMNYLIGYLEAKGGASLGDYAKYYYFQNYGETEARNVSQRLDMTEEERRALPIENNGEVFSYDEVFEKIVDNLKAIGYNKKQIDTILKEGVSYDIEQTDVQTSADEVVKRRRNDREETGRLSDADENGRRPGEIYRTGKIPTAGVSESAEILDSERRNGGLRRGNRGTDSQNGALGAGSEAGKRLNEVSKPEKRFSLSSNVEQIIENDSGEFVAESDGNGGTRWSLSTYESSGRETLRQYLDGQVSESGLTEADAKAVLDSMDEIYEICRKYEGEYAPFGAWSRAEVVIDEKGNPVFSVIKPNGEYAMNLDFSLVCKKRRALDAVLNRLIETGAINDFGFGQEEIVRVNEIIREHGFEIACDMCFVDAKRYRQAGVADQFVDLYNSIVKSMAKDGQEIDYFNFANDSSLSHTEGGIDRLSDAELDFSEINEITKPGAKKTVEYRIAQYLKTHPSDRKLLSRGDFMSTAGFDAVKVSKPDILKLYNSKKGTGGPKAAQSDVQYLNDILSSKKFNRSAAYDVGGVRVQSFSDYVPRLVFDYVQMIGDLAAKRLPAHAYTKEPLFAKQFGLTGMKINMSLMPAKGNGKYAGLNADGSYAWARESFPVEEAFRIQADPEYGKNVGTIAVGISDEHIWKMLSDPDIRMVIPYHKSGINPAVAVKLKIGEYTDYTGQQNTVRRDGKQLTKAELKNIPDINRLMHRDGLDAVEASRRYVEWCEDNGYIPKFEKFAYMTDSDGNRVFNENYYKLLEDFTTMVDGEFHPQGDVTATFPGSDSAFGSMADLIKEGLEEDAVTANRLNGEVDGLAEEVRSALGREESGKRFSLTRANDEYMKAVESGNVEEQQRLVDEAAENAGYDSPKVFHQTGERFWEFKTDNPVAGAYDSETPNGIFFKSNDHDIGVGGNYVETGRGGEIQMAAYLRMENTLHFSDRKEANAWYVKNVPGYEAAQTEMQKAVEPFDRQIDALDDEFFVNDSISEEEYDRQWNNLIEKLRETENKYRKRLREILDDYFLTGNSGYDSIELDYDGHRYIDGKRENVHTYIVFDGSQVKSADPITYDDSGNVIPLTERFDSGNRDIRYSLVKSAQSELKALQKENEKLRQDVDDLKQELQLTHGRKLSRDALISSIQKILIDRYGVKLSAKELYPHVTNLYDMFYNNTVDGKRLKKDERVDTMRIIEEMDKIVDAVIENAVGVDDTYVEMKKLLPELRNTKLVVPMDARADAAQSAGFENWAEFRKANFGRVGFANEGLPVDTYYMELSERYPELFPDGITHPGEQAAHIADVVNTIRESGINEYQLYDIEDERIRTSIKNDVMDIIGNAEKLQTFADRAAQKVEDTKLAEAMHYGADIAKLKRLNSEKAADIKAENRKRLSDMRRKYQDRVESVRERYAEARANRSEKQKQTVLRNKVLRKYTEASSMLDRPTTENHFTEAMREPLMEFLAAVDITTGKSVAKQGIYDRILRVIEAANKVAAEGGKDGLDIAETDLNVQEKQLIVDSGLLERMSAWVEANKGKKLTELSSAQLFDQIVSNEPPVGYVHLDLLQQPYFAADTVRISYEQHTEKNLRLDSRASVILAVIRLADSAGTSSSNTILSQA